MRVREGRQEKSVQVPRVKATFRLDPENLVSLEAERLRRIAAGVPRSQADLSDLVNEAIRHAYGRGR